MNKISYYIWIIATFMLISCGIFYTIKLKFPQFRFKRMFKSINDTDRNKSGISPFESLTLALASRVGVGSLSGIALSIYRGGIGTIFWIWVSCLLILPNAFVESTLSVIYHKKRNNKFEGNPSFYISEGLNKKKLAIAYALIVAFCQLFGFTSIQSNTMATSLNYYYHIPLIISGIVLAILSFMIVIGNLKRITAFLSKQVLFMGIIYVLVSILIIVINIKNVPNLILNIVREAFNFKALGWGVFASLIIGVQRGIFSSESGTGSGAIASGASDTKTPINQGFIQTIGVYFTIFVVCTSTALIILTSNVDVTSYHNPNGIEIVLSALNYHLGDIGNIFLIIMLISFSFSTVLSAYVYGESGFKYLFPKMKENKIILIKVLLFGIIILSSIVSPVLLWDFVDMGTALMSIINVYAIYNLRRIMIYEYNKK
ncbi:MAG: alanine:cation symporter family protein [Bacilli bacterium]|nr:alanine:cation symporter family protein [Bacilli bacterium]